MARREPPPPSSRLTRCSTVGAFGLDPLELDLGWDLDVSLDIQQPGRHPRNLGANIRGRFPRGNRIGATELAGVGQGESEGGAPDEAMGQLSLSDGRRIAYCHRADTQLTRGCAGIIFLCGFRSDMTGTKAGFLDSHCAARGL